MFMLCCDIHIENLVFRRIKYYSKITNTNYEKNWLRQNALRQGSSTRGPRAACGPPAGFVRPGKGISQSTMSYEY